jgi:hypothetical protein
MRQVDGRTADGWTPDGWTTEHCVDEGTDSVDIEWWTRTGAGRTAGMLASRPLRRRPSARCRPEAPPGVPLVWPWGEGQFDPEAGALAGSRGDRGAAAVGLGDGGHDRQSQPGATLAAGA